MVCRLPGYIKSPENNIPDLELRIRTPETTTPTPALCLGDLSHGVMASNAIKSPLPGDSLHPSEVRAKAALDERDEKSIIRVGFRFGRILSLVRLFFLPIFYEVMHQESPSGQHRASNRARSLRVYVSWSIRLYQFEVVNTCEFVALTCRSALLCTGAIQAPLSARLVGRLRARPRSPLHVVAPAAPQGCRGNVLRAEGVEPSCRPYAK